MTEQTSTETGYWLGVAERDYQRGVQLTSERRLPEAEQALLSAVTMLAGLHDAAGASRWRLDVGRLLALAHWRRALVAHLDGRPAEALLRAREGLEVGIGRLDRLEPGSDAHSEATAQVVTMMIDAAAAAAEAGLGDESLAFYEAAIGRCGDDPHPCVLGVLATALHNKANAMLLRLAARRDETAPGELAASMETVARSAGQAIAIRLDLLVESDVVSCWALACSELLGAQVLLYGGETTAAVRLLALGLGHVRALGPDGRQLGVKAAELARTMNELVPDEMAAAREAGLLELS
jgi:hypothetical protein